MRKETVRLQQSHAEARDVGAFKRVYVYMCVKERDRDRDRDPTHEGTRKEPGPEREKERDPTHERTGSCG